MLELMINCDMGEGCASDAEVMPYLDYANISCGAHAGSIYDIENTIRLAKKYDVIIGAHPGYADKANFGRVSLDLPLENLRQSLIEQVNLLQELCQQQKVKVEYLKPHGALNHDMLAKPKIFNTICQVISQLSLNIPVVVPTCPQVVELRTIADSWKVGIIWEIFADRAYETSGLLRPRSRQDALHDNPEQIISQYHHAKTENKIISYDGVEIDIGYARTICIHGDHPPSIIAVKQFR